MKRILFIFLVQFDKFSFFSFLYILSSNASVFFLQNLLMDVRDKLLFEPEYAGNTRERVPPKSSLRIPWGWLPGALCLLQEVPTVHYQGSLLAMISVKFFSFCFSNMDRCIVIFGALFSLCS